MQRSQYGQPLLLRQLGGADHSAEVLARVPLSTSEGTYNEAWLQDLIVKCPTLLPIAEIEPALVPAIPICTELSVPSGWIDILLATPAGDLIVVETKLWRNPEARREVVGQVLDYAKDLASWTYEQLEAASRAARSRLPNPGTLSLHKLVGSTHDAEIDEAAFVDAVSRNLRRGRILLLIVGDGIREGAEAMAAFLQEHAGLHFTLALVELAIFVVPGPAPTYFVQPRTLARTTNIDRGIVSVENDRISVRPPAGPGTPPVKPTSISEERFYEELEARHPGTADKLKAFVSRLSDLGIFEAFGTKSLSMKWRPDEDHTWTLCAILTDGKVWTEYIQGQANSVGLLALSHQYLEGLARVIPEAYVKKPSDLQWHVDRNGTYILVDDLLANADQWIAVTQEFMRDVREALRQKEEG